MILQHDRLAGRTVQLSKQSLHLLNPNILIRLEPLCAEQLHQAHPPRLAPVRAVRGPRDVGVIVRRVLPGGGFRPRSEGDVHGFEEHFGHVDGGPDDDGEGPEPEVHDGAVFLGEGVEGAVGEGADEVEVADYGPGGGARREVELAAAAEGGGEEEEGRCC